jgi:predicted nucleic acid-binding Zn ribbon protein
MRRVGPRPAAAAIDALAERLAPQTPLSLAQRAWPAAVGDAVAAQAHPTGARDGVLTVTCSSAVWAHELDLMAPALIERLNAVLGAGSVRSLRCQAAPAKAWAREASER